MLGEAPITETKKILQKRLDTCSKNSNNSKLNSQHNQRGDLYDHFNEHGNLHFDDEQDIHTSSRHYKASGYGLDLDLDFAKPLRTNHMSYEKWPSGKNVTI